MRFRGVPAGIFATGSGSVFFGPKSGFTGSGSGLLASPIKAYMSDSEKKMTSMDFD